MADIEVRTSLDADVLAEILELIDETTRIEGHRPVGEHKYSHLAVGATGWTGILAREDGRLVGYAHTRWNAPTDQPRVAVEVVVHPDLAGDRIARELLDATRRLVGRSGGGLLYLWVHRVGDPQSNLAARMGFAVQRELAFMTRPLDEAPGPPRLPDGVVVRPYREGADDEDFLAVNNAAFAGHPENGGWDLQEFAARRKRDWFDPNGLLMAWRCHEDGREELLGFHWTKWHGHESDEVPAHGPVGEVYVLGVSPEAHGMGLGRGLLIAGLDYLHSLGCRLAVLYVDGASETAVRLYASAGFEVAYKEVCYEETVPAASTADPPQ